MKELKNYLHLYLGCEGEATIRYSPGTATQVKAILTAIRTDGRIIIQGFDKSGKQWADEEVIGINDFKPFLRPLSSITEERKELDDIRGDTVIDTIIHANYNLANPERIRYLLNKRFDLFELIESNLAIDEIKHNTPNNN